MAIKRTDPLNWNVPIVDAQGRPTREFQQKWLQQNTLNGSIPLDAASMSAALDLIGTTANSLLLRGASVWGIGTASSVLDVIGQTRGGLLYRGATGWSQRVPSTAGYVLTDGGVGADPVWAAPLSPANPTATASDTAVNGSASTFMRSDAAPAIQKASNTVFGLVKVDGTTITATGGVISAAGGGGASQTEFNMLPFDPHNSTTFSSGFFGGHALVMPAAATISSIKFWATAASASAVVYPAIYSSSGVNISTLLGAGSGVTGITQGLNKLPLTSGISLTKGQLVFIGLALNTASFSAGTYNHAGTVYFSNTGAPPSTPGTTTYVAQGWANMWASTDT